MNKALAGLGITALSIALTGASAPAQAQRGRGVSMTATIPVTQGIGAVPSSVLRIDGSVDGRRALNTERKTSPDTDFLPADPMSVTLISRPDTPRFRRSSASSVPTLVRGSAPNQLDNCARVYVRVDQMAEGDPASNDTPAAARSGDPRR